MRIANTGNVLLKKCLELIATPNISNFHDSYFFTFFHINFFFSGNLVIETKFYDEDLLISISKVRLFYV